jgi:hypothetical protein
LSCRSPSLISGLFYVHAMHTHTPESQLSISSCRYVMLKDRGICGQAFRGVGVVFSVASDNGSELLALAGVAT